MLSHIKRHLSPSLCALLLSLALLLPAHLLSQIHHQITQACEQIATRDKQISDQGNTQEAKQPDEQKPKKPTMAESWRKIITLRWKAINRDDAWNIGKPFAGAIALGLLYRYWPKSNTNNNDNFDDDNFDFSSEEEVPSDPEINASLLANIHNEGVPNEVQVKIAHLAFSESIERSSKRSDKKRDLLAHKQTERSEYLRTKLLTHSSACIILEVYSDEYCLSDVTDDDIDAASVDDDDCYFQSIRAFRQMHHNMIIPQANLIDRMLRAHEKGITFVIYHQSEDGKVFLMFDKNIRMLLLRLLNIKLQVGKP